MEMYNNIKVIKEQKYERTLFNKYKIRKGHLMEHILVKFFLENDLPTGARNNYIWFQIKCLLKESGIDFKGDETKKLHQLTTIKYGSGFNLNVPENRFKFNPDVVNKYCIMNLIPPLFDLWESKIADENFRLDNLDWNNLWMTHGEKISLPVDTDINEDMREAKKLMVRGSFDNIITLYKFTNGCIDKYGEEKTKYYFTYLFKRYIGYI